MRLWFISLFVASAALADVGFHPSLETGVQSTYVFRGALMYRSPISPSGQTSAGLGVDGVGPGTLLVTMWNATALANHGEHFGNQLEFDLSLSYAWKAFGLQLVAGLTSYLYPEATTVDQAHEVHLFVAYPSRFATPFVSINAEFVRQRGAYVQAGAYRDFSIDDFTITPRVALAGLGYAAVAPTLSDVFASLAVRWQLNRLIYLLGSASAAARFIQPNTSPIIWGGLAIGVAQ